MDLVLHSILGFPDEITAYRNGFIKIFKITPGIVNTRSSITHDYSSIQNTDLTVEQIQFLVSRNIKLHENDNTPDKDFSQVEKHLYRDIQPNLVKIDVENNELETTDGDKFQSTDDIYLVSGKELDEEIEEDINIDGEVEAEAGFVDLFEEEDETSTEKKQSFLEHFFKL